MQNPLSFLTGAQTSDPGVGGSTESSGMLLSRTEAAPPRTGVSVITLNLLQPSLTQQQK